MNLAHVATCIAETLRGSSIVFLADDEQQAEALAAIVAAITPSARTLFLPSSDALPGDTAPASPANTGRRVATLRALRALRNGDESARLALILSGEAAARRYPSPDAFDSAPPRWRPGDSIELDSVAAQLENLGYIADDRVDEPGEMAIRGEVIDIFPADAGTPARIDVVDGRIVAIRAYDPVTQLTTDDLDALEIGRASEPEIGDAVPILAHLTASAIAMAPKADQRRQRFLQLAMDASRGGTVDAVADDAWAKALAGWRPVTFDADVAPVPRFAGTRSPFAAFTRFAKPLIEDGRTLLLAGAERDLRFLRPRLAKRLDRTPTECSSWTEIRDLPNAAFAMAEMPIDAGFVGDGLVVIAAADLLGSRAAVGDAPSTVANPLTGASADIRIGDIVVHEDHGVGRVAGLEQTSAKDDAAEMIALEYAGGTRRLVAIDEADRIWRYGADADAVTLDKLDGSSWQKRRGDIDAAIAESAKGLAALAAERSRLTAPALEPDRAAYERLANGFAFSETADQARAIAAVRDDLASGKPMDRLVVGDVGYGKTEVALRAAAIAALAGYQVVIAAPTTVLVRQHVESFRRRFEASGVTVESLSRLSSTADRRRVKAGLADGSIGIVIGTGAVMGKGVTFAKLGLVVIDEEQRFGAADKTRLRGTASVHLLALSATPIPRTLQMALVGLQQVSIIATPPARRQPIRTSVGGVDEARIRTALLRERARGGQSFVVVPRIEDLAAVGEMLTRLVPQLTLVTAHGKLPAADIDEAMVEFAGGRGDILLATNIIEAGLDVPRANTMIVWRADRFGLAQLHQLRGRVGRGNRRGQVLLVTDAAEGIGDRTLKRLRTLATSDRLGAGFDISARDLDMRGAGDLLGEAQAGHTKLIGIDLYQHLLQGALSTARGERFERWMPEVNVGAGGALPRDWIPEDDVRLALYVRLARIDDDAALEEFAQELGDRFGPMPAAAEAMVAHARIRIAARNAGIQRIEAGPAAIAFTPRHDFHGDPTRAGLVEKNGRFLLTESVANPQLADRLDTLLSELSPQV